MSPGRGGLSEPIPGIGHGTNQDHGHWDWASRLNDRNEQDIPHHLAFLEFAKKHVLLVEDDELRVGVLDQEDMGRLNVMVLEPGNIAIMVSAPLFRGTKIMTRLRINIPSRSWRLNRQRSWSWGTSWSWTWGFARGHFFSKDAMLPIRSRR